MRKQRVLLTLIREHERGFRLFILPNSLLNLRKHDLTCIYISGTLFPTFVTIIHSHKNPKRSDLYRVVKSRKSKSKFQILVIQTFRSYSYRIIWTILKFGDFQISSKKKKIRRKLKTAVRRNVEEKANPCDRKPLVDLYREQ